MVIGDVDDTASCYKKPCQGFPPLSISAVGTKPLSSEGGAAVERIYEGVVLVLGESFGDLLTGGGGLANDGVVVVVLFVVRRRRRRRRRR